MIGGFGAAYVSTDDGVFQVRDADVRADEHERLMLELGAGPVRASSSELAGPDDDCDDDCTCGDDLGYA